MIELKHRSESELYGRLKKYRMVIDHGSFSYQLAYYLKKYNISQRSRSLVRLKNSKQYEGLTNKNFTPYFDDKSENDLTLDDLISCITELDKKLMSSESKFHFVAPNKSFSGSMLDTIYDWARDVKSEVKDENIPRITCEEIKSESDRVKKIKSIQIYENTHKTTPEPTESIIFDGDIAKIELFDEDYYALPLSDEIWNEFDNSNKTRKIILLYYGGNIGLYPLEKNSAVHDKPNYIIFPKKALERNA